MKTLTFLYLTLLFFTNVGTSQTTVTEKQPDPIEKELNAYWAEVSRSVKEGDFAGYSATCHPLGILVSGNKKTSYPLATALAKWKQGFEDTKAKKITLADHDGKPKIRWYGGGVESVIAINPVAQNVATLAKAWKPDGTAKNSKRFNPLCPSLAITATMH